MTSANQISLHWLGIGREMNTRSNIGELIEFNSALLYLAAFDSTERSLRLRSLIPRADTPKVGVVCRVGHVQTLNRESVIRESRSFPIRCADLG